MSETFVRAVVALLSAGCESALDVGSGPGKYPAPVGRWETIDQYAVAPSHQHHQGNALDVLRSMPSGSFDLVYALDFIEHLKFPDGLALLAEMERVASKVVLVFTPHGFMRYHNEAPGMEHLSGWKKRDFRTRGYLVHVCEFDYGVVTRTTEAIWAVLRKAGK